MVEHDLKTWPQFFSAVVSGAKTFELRKDDRSFEVGDTLLLREFDPAANQYSGRKVRKIVTHILRHDPDVGCAATFGLLPGYVIMSLINGYN